jgi:hypothetical protein
LSCDSIHSELTREATKFIALIEHGPLMGVMGEDIQGPSSFDMVNIEIPAILHSAFTSYNRVLNYLWIQLLSFFSRQ